MLKAIPSDAVYIGTPVFCHKKQIELAIAYGRHIFVEKPIAMNAEEGRALLDQCRAANLQLTVGYMMKYHSLHERAKAMISIAHPQFREELAKYARENFK